MNSRSLRDEERVLVIAPTAKDGQFSEALFAQVGLPCAICLDIATFAAELARGAGVVVLTQEALAPDRRQELLAALVSQPVWSALPLIMLASTGSQQLLSAPLVQQLGNVLVLERPIAAQTLLSVVQMALRTRRRQYQARLVAEANQLLAASLGDDNTLNELTALLVPRLADCCLLYVLDGATPRLAATSFAAAQPDELRAALAGAPHNDGSLSLGQEAVATDAASALAEAHLRLVGATAQLVVPLHTHGRLFGAVALGMLASERAFGAEERQVVQEIADRTALALDQLQMYQAEQAARTEAEAVVLAHNELIALISHDLNNPLTAVLGQTQLLQRQLAENRLLPERLLRGINSIGRAARQMQVQIVELLDVARLRANQPLDVQREAADLIALAQTVIAAVQQTTERHQLYLHTELSSLVVLLDPVRIERVLANLLSNAVKYSPDGGTIRVVLEVERADAENWAVVHVQDQGIGIPAADLPYIFERFRRASNVPKAIYGTGLGLASVRQIVEQHGGQVTVANGASGGAIFTLRIPSNGAAG